MGPGKGLARGPAKSEVHARNVSASRIDSRAVARSMALSSSGLRALFSFSSRAPQGAGRSGTSCPPQRSLVDDAAALATIQKEIRVNSPYQVHLEMIERTLQPTSCFQLQAAKHKVLVVCDMLTEDKEYCEALLLKIDHLLGQETVPTVPRSAGDTVLSTVASKGIRNAA